MTCVIPATKRFYSRNSEHDNVTSTPYTNACKTVHGRGAIKDRSEDKKMTEDDVYHYWGNFFSG